MSLQLELGLLGVGERLRVLQRWLVHEARVTRERVRVPGRVHEVACLQVEEREGKEDGHEQDGREEDERVEARVILEVHEVADDQRGLDDRDCLLYTSDAADE